MNGKFEHVNHQPIPAIPEGDPGKDKLFPGKCAPIPCAGINDAEAAATPWPPEPPVQITPGADGWTAVEMYLRGPACPWDTTGIADALEAKSHFGADRAPCLRR